VKRLRIVAAIVAVVTAMAAWSWTSLRADRAAQVKAHTVLAFTY